jgi:Ran GTPase-activating protein (RanGAP) involved in mRNA processing and transport
MPPDAILLASDLSQAVVTGELTALDLSSNDLKDEDVSAICEAIRSNKETKLASLNFKCNGIGPVGAIAVAAMVAVTSSLTSLNLSENALCGRTYVGGTYTAEGITAIADALRHNGGLTSIDLSRNQLCGISDDWTCQQGTYTTEGITAIADALRVNGVLTKLSLAWNKLEEQGTKAICEALEQNRTLRELDLSGRNNIGGEAATKHVADMLGVNGGLTSINLSNNVLCGVDNWGQGTYTAEGITAIAHAMRVNVNGALTALDLSSNDLKDEGVCAVCEAIQSNKETKLASLNFKNNGIGPGGANAVAAMVAVTGALTKME